MRFDGVCPLPSRSFPFPEHTHTHDRLRSVNNGSSGSCDIQHNSPNFREIGRCEIFRHPKNSDFRRVQQLIICDNLSRFTSPTTRSIVRCRFACAVRILCERPIKKLLHIFEYHLFTGCTQQLLLLFMLPCVVHEKRETRKKQAQCISVRPQLTACVTAYGLSSRCP